MRIAIFTNNYLPNPFGISRSIESFRTEFEKRGHIVYVFAPYAKGYVDDNTNVYRYPSINLKYKICFPLPIPYSRRIDNIVEILPLDIIHSQHPNLLGSAARKWAKKKNAPLIFTWHTLYDRFAHFVPLMPEKWAANWAIRNAVQYANLCDQIIVPTKSVENIIRDWGVVNRNIADVMSGVNEAEFVPADGEEVRKRYGIAKDEVLAFVIGRITTEKNMDFLMRSMSFALKQNKNLRFMVSGEGYDLPILKKIAEENNVAGKVIYTGLVVGRERNNCFAAADFFVYSSKSETQGMILTEAHYMGLPIVAIDATGVRDIVKNNETGFLVHESEEEFTKAVIKVAEDSDLRKIFSENAKQIAKEKYTSSVCTDRMLAVYHEALCRR